MKKIFTLLAFTCTIHFLVAQDWRSESGLPVKITALSKIRDTLFLASNNQVFFSKRNGPFQVILDPPKYNNNPNPFQSNGKFLFQKSWFFPSVTLQQVFTSDVFGSTGSLMASFNRGLTLNASPGYQSFSSIKSSSQLESVFGDDQGRVGYYSAQTVSNFGLSYSGRISLDAGRTWKTLTLERFERPLAFYQDVLVTQLDQNIQHKNLSTGQVTAVFPIPLRKRVIESHGVLIIPDFNAADSVQTGFNWSKDYGVTWKRQSFSWDHLDFWKLTPSGEIFFDKLFVIGDYLILWDGPGSKEIYVSALTAPNISTMPIPCESEEYINNFFESEGQLYAQLNSGKLYVASGVFQPWATLPIPVVQPAVVQENTRFKWVPGVGWANENIGINGGAFTQDIFVQQGGFNFQGQGDLLMKLGNQYIFAFDRKLYTSPALPILQKSLLPLPSGFQQVLNTVEVFENGLLLWGYDNTTFQYRFARSFDAMHWEELPPPPANETPIYLRHLKGKTYLSTLSGIYAYEAGQWILTTGTALAIARQFDATTGKFFLLNAKDQNANCGMELLLSEDGIHWSAQPLPVAPVLWTPCNYVPFYALWYQAGEILLSGNNQLYKLANNNWEPISDIPFVGAPGFAGMNGDRLFLNTMVQGLWSVQWKTLFPKPVVNCAQNILINGDFQTGSSGWEGNGTLITEPEGNKYLRSCVNTEPPRVNIKVQPGKNYALKAIARKSNAQSKGVLSLKFLTDSWQVVHQSNIAIQSTEWKLYELSALAPPDAYWLEVALRSADQQCVEADDFCLSTDGINGPLPDLLVTGTVPSNFPAALIPGATFNYNINYRNSGDAAVLQNFKFSLYLSIDQNLDAQDWKVNEGLVYAPFEVFPKSSGGAGGISTLPIVNPGSYYWIFVLDAEGLISETNKSNNQFIQQVTIIPDGLPNLNLRSMVLGTNQVNAGTAVTLDYQFVNDGSQEVTQIHTDKAWLSKDPLRSSDDVLLFQYTATTPFLPVYGSVLFSAYSRGFFSVNIPVATPSGNWYILLQMNANNDFNESTTLDNLLAKPIQVTGSNNSCTASSDFPWEDWISKVRIGTQNYPSGKSVYSNFAGKVFQVQSDEPVPVEVGATFSWQAYKEYMRIWVDLNQDGFFEASELWWSGTLAKPANGYAEHLLKSTAAVPSSWNPGFYKLRIIMTRNQYPEPCGTIPFGEVEDYTLEVLSNLAPGSQTRNPFDPQDQNGYRVSRFGMYPVPASDYVWVETAPWAGQDMEVTLVNALGRPVKVWPFQRVNDPWSLLNLTGIPPGSYYLQITAKGRRTLTAKLVVEPGY